jgi:AcrR family transcriptional regulator
LLPAARSSVKGKSEEMTGVDSEAEARPLRRDAEENRDKLLVAAAQVFDAQGLDGSVTEIARVAGVGMGTLYRRFPTKEALIEALVHEVLDATIRMATDAAECPRGAGLEEFLTASANYQAQHAGCLPRLWDTDSDLVKEARLLIAKLLDDAKAHGRVRQDLTPTDLTLAMFSLQGVIEATLSVAPEAWRRHLDLLVAGMRPADQDLGHPPVSNATLDRILTRRRRAGTDSMASPQSANQSAKRV